MKATVGDKLLVRGTKKGHTDRTAVVLEVRGNDGGPPYLVRWADDGREGLIFPGSDTRVQAVQPES